MRLRSATGSSGRLRRQRRDSHFVLVPMAAAALEQVLEWGVERIAAALAQVTGRIERDALARGLDPLPAHLRGPHRLGIRRPPAGFEQRLAAQRVHVEVLGSVMRVSPHLHVADRDLERLFAALGELVGS